jgi:uncharacterized glyoxalase superfamily protein PhnB
MKLKRISPVLFVDAVEPCLPFWEALGFSRTVEVPDNLGKLGFVILARDGFEVMYQSRTSAKTDVPALAEGAWRSALYLEVDDLDGWAKLVKGAPQVFARRKTFYGAEELGVKDPAGNVVTFAQQAP